MNKLRSKLLLSFLLCMTLPAGLGAIVLAYETESSVLDGAAHDFETGRVYLQQSHQAARDFFNFARRDPYFFRTGGTPGFKEQTERLRGARAYPAAAR